MACMLYFARCMNIIFNTAGSYKSQNKINTRYFYHLIIIIFTD